MRHADEAAFLWRQRLNLVDAPHLSLAGLAAHDERIAAHLDGLHVAGEAAAAPLEAQLEDGTPGSMFAAAVIALETCDAAWLESLVALAEATPQMQCGLAAAFGWVTPGLLQGSVSALLDHASPMRRRLGLTACTLHRVDPGQALTAALADADPALQASALRCAGELGRTNLLGTCQQHLAHPDDDVRFEAVCAAVLLGDRAAAVDALSAFVLTSGPHAADALMLFLLVSVPAQGHAFLSSALRTQGRTRDLIRGSGLVGARKYVPWLLGLMDEPLHARLAGEAFALITGLDIAEGFDTPAPQDLALGPNDNPDDLDVAMDEDGDLPWPDAPKVAAWWAAHQGRFPQDVRHFLGKPLQPGPLTHVLRQGRQRQRHQAALLLSVMQPGTPLFDTAAPSRRQQRALAAP